MNLGPLGIILLVLGICLLAFGVMESDSITSSFSRLFTGEPTDRAVFLLIAGAVSTCAGLALGFRGRRA